MPLCKTVGELKDALDVYDDETPVELLHGEDVTLGVDLYPADGGDGKLIAQLCPP